MNEKVLFSSNSIYWETPTWLFDRLNDEFNFNLDVCANEDNHKCKKYFTEEIDGLKQDWSNHICWMNPPYGKDINKWMRKAYEESLKGAIVVCLIPCRTDTKYWHKYVMRASEIRYIEGRLKFGSSNNSAPFPSVIIVFDRNKNFNTMAYNYKNNLKMVRLRKK